MVSLHHPKSECDSSWLNYYKHKNITCAAAPQSSYCGTKKLPGKSSLSTAATLGACVSVPSTATTFSSRFRTRLKFICPSKLTFHFQSKHLFCVQDRLVGLVVRRPPRERKIPGSNPACGGIFSGSSHTSDLNIGTPVATLPGAWRYRVSAGTGRPGVSIL